MKDKKKPVEHAVVANDPNDRKGTLKAIGGSQSDAWNSIIANSTLQTLWLRAIG